MSLSVSVVITTYNKPEYLSVVLDAYVRQSVRPGELLIADDGSGGETAEVVKRFERDAPFPVTHVW